MQIHELNNFTGTLGSGAYLAVDDGNDTGKLSTQQLLAATEARIDNIIAGPAPSAQEVTDARLGDDGVTYPSLGDAIRDQVGDLKSDLFNDENKSYYFSEARYSSSSSEGWKLVPSTGLCTSDSDYKILKYTITGNAIVKVQTDGVFQFQTSSSVPSTGTSNRIGKTYSAGEYILVAPSTATYLILSILQVGGVANVYDGINKVDKLSDDVGVEIGSTPIYYNTAKQYYNLAGSSVTMSGGHPQPTGRDENYLSGYIACSEGDTFTLNLTGGVSARAYAFVKANGDIIEKSGESKTISNTEYTAPAESAFLIIQTSGSKTCFKGKTVINEIKALWNNDGYRYLSSKGFYVQTTETGYAIQNNKSVGTIINIDAPTAEANMASIVVHGVSEGMKFRIFGTSTYYYVIYSFLDKDNKLINHADAWTPSHELGLIVTAPPNATTLVSSSKADYEYGFNVQYLGSADYLSQQLGDISRVVDVENRKANLKKNKTASFAFFSDVHGNETNVQRIIDYAESNGLDAVINGGDIVNRYLNDNDYSFSWYATLLGNSTVDVLSAVGNHDAWDGAYFVKASDADVYNAIVAPIVSNFDDIVQPTGASANGLCYYYKDYSSVRVIVLNAMAGADSVNFWTTAQGDWLTSVLSDAKANSKHVIICNHPPFPKNIALRDEKSNWNSYYDYRTSASYDDISFQTPALDIIKSFVDSGGMLICILSGHIHADSILTASGYNGLFMVNIATANNALHTDGVTYTSAESAYFDCFDHCVVDATNGIFKLMRIGWNYDASMKERDTLSYDYFNHKLIHE